MAIVDDEPAIYSKDVADRYGIKGFFFHSMKEGRRFVELRLLQTGGVISELQRQVAFKLSTVAPSGVLVHIGEYRADFTYRDQKGRFVVEDVKGPARREDLYLWKRRHVQAQYGITIIEV